MIANFLKDFNNSFTASFNRTHNFISKKGLQKINMAVVAMTAITMLVFSGSVSVFADSHTCPEGDGWTKVEGLSGLSYTFTVPDGFEVVANCMKVGDHDPLFGTGNTVTNTTLFNTPGGAVCTAPGVPHNGCELQGISHASFQLVPLQRPTPTQGVTPTMTPMVPTPTDVVPTPTTAPTATPVVPTVTPGRGPTATRAPQPTATRAPQPTPTNTPVGGGVNPLVLGIQESYGQVLGAASDKLPRTGEVSALGDEYYPSGNVVIDGSQIFIPRIGLNEPLYFGRTVGNEMIVGSGEVLQTGNTNNRVIYAHNTTSTFGQIQFLSQGDSIFHSDGNGLNEYQVTEVMKVSDAQAEVMYQNDSNVIVLITCDIYDASRRVVVIARLLVQ